MSLSNILDNTQAVRLIKLPHGFVAFVAQHFDNHCTCTVIFIRNCKRWKVGTISTATNYFCFKLRKTS